MKKIFWLLLLFFLGVNLCSGKCKSIEYAQFAAILDTMDIPELNERQQVLFDTRIDNFYAELETLSPEEQQSKLSDFFIKLRDGFKIFRIARMNAALRDSIEVFEKKTGLLVYTYSYVEDNSFLDNIFKELSEAHYESVSPRAFIKLHAVFNPQSGTGEKTYSPKYNIELSEEIETLIQDRNAEISASTLMADASAVISEGNQNVSSDAIKGIALTKFPEATLKTLRQIETLNPNDRELGWGECWSFCNKDPLERCAYVFMKLLEEYDEEAIYRTYENAGFKYYVVTASIQLGENPDEKFQIEKEFRPQSYDGYLEDYKEFLRGWQVDPSYIGLIEYNSTINPVASNGNNCINHCTNIALRKPPAAVQFIADVLTSPYTAPGKIIYGKNFIFEDQEVTTLDRYLAFMDVPGVGYVSKSVLVKLGVKPLVKGASKALGATEVLDDLIKNSGKSKAVVDEASDAIKSLPEAERITALNAVVAGAVVIEDLPEAVQIIKASAKKTWPELLELFRKAKEFETNVSVYLASKFTTQRGYKVFNQIYLKDPVTGVVSVADNVIYNSRTKKFILNESKFGAGNILTKNQKIIEDAIKSGQALEVRTLGGMNRIELGEELINAGDLISFEGIIRSNSIDGTITGNIFSKIWGSIDLNLIK